HAIAKELQSVLIGQRLGKAYQLGTTDLYLDFRLRDGRSLMISTDPQRLAIYLTSRSIKQFAAQPRIDTNFVLLIKKYLSGAQVAGLEHLGYDRVVHINFQAEDEAGHKKSRTLIVELTGPSANVLIVEEGRIIAELRERKSEAQAEEHIDEIATSAETIKLYTDPEPPTNKLDPFDCPPEKLHAIIEQSSGLVAAAARKYLIGFGPLYAQELTARAKTQPPEMALQSLLNDLFNRELSPRVYSSAPLAEMREQIGADNFAVVFSPIDLIHQTGRVLTYFESINEAADATFTLLDERARFATTKQQLSSNLSARLKKQRTLLSKLKQESERFARDEQAQRFGELLLANAHHAAKVDDVFLVTDYYDPEQATIEIPSAESA
ncbi:MAG TPA: NFACT family protein, partial [Blastocatellia bacterium]|nr:NFACT family protein [Blastocatellia bacterium]